MDENSQPTQPVDEPRRFGRTTSSEISTSDATDVICLLHPTSPAAFEAMKANQLLAKDHILQNTDLGASTGDDLFPDQPLQQPRDLALRMSSRVKCPKDGFRFGRLASQCDVILTPMENDNLVSKVHFKIFVNSQGSLMLQDLSTNGTIVDDTHLKQRDRRGHVTLKPATMVLKHASIISVVCGKSKEEIKFMVRIPTRGDHEDAYEANLKQYLAARGDVAQFASMRESSYGNHWNGGSLYNFTGLLGKGAFATVYRVQTKKEGDVFAAKELDKRRFIKNGILDMKFDSELNIMKNLKHPNIVNYVDCQTYQHWIYILMEYVPYGELSQELRRCGGSIPEPDMQQVARQILHALDYLHRRNITHRDIKPDNILIASRSPLVVKLSDFGLSKCVGDQETFLKTFCGTLLYCAPEVYPDYAHYAQTAAPKRRRFGDHGTRPTPSPYDQSVDMWSFGAVIFHTLSGKPPIAGRGDDRGAQMLSNIMTKNVDFDPLRVVGASDHAIDFITRLLNRNPAVRPREPECLRHPWLRDLPDHCNYQDVDTYGPHLALDVDVGAEDEPDDDWVDDELIYDLGQMTQAPSSGHTPERPTKRPKTATEPGPATIPGHPSPHVVITYPSLPEHAGDSEMAPPAAGPRLFGEISPSMQRSSGVFGLGQAPTTRADVRALRDGVENIRVDDAGSAELGDRAASADISGQPLLYPHPLEVPTGQAGSAPSLLGAEHQIGQLNMASPEGELSDAATPETTNPVTPQTRELSPSGGAGHHASAASAGTVDTLEEPVFTRRIDMALISNPVDFDTELEARQASRAGKLAAKAETFHHARDVRHPAGFGRLEATMDAKTERLIGTTGAQSATEAVFVKPAKRFGKMTSIPGSFTNVTINLEDRFTVWGRGVDCTCKYVDTKDTRIPKYALKIAFWAPGMEKHVEQGGDWTRLPAIRTVLSTSASGCIWVNGKELRKETVNGDAALFGTLYTGDVITVYDDGKSTFLKFRVEITFGESAKNRPATEAGFVVQQERHHHQRMKERESLRLSRAEDDAPTDSTTRAISLGCS